MKNDFGPQELLGLVSISAFLVGFLTVRLQATLQDWRQNRDVLVNRQLQQNESENLLPLPRNLERKQTVEIETLNIVTKLTLLATLTSLVVSILAIAYSACASSDLKLCASNVPFSMYAIQVVHLIIVAIGFVDVGYFRRTITRESISTPSARFGELVQSLESWLDGRNSADQVLNKCDELDAVLPNWCWLSLIRFQLLEGKDASLEPEIVRLQRMASDSKDFDIYSLICSVWSKYLLQENASLYVRHSELKEIEKFRLRTGGDIIARLSLASGPALIHSIADS